MTSVKIGTIVALNIVVDKMCNLVHILEKKLFIKSETIDARWSGISVNVETIKHDYWINSHWKLTVALSYDHRLIYYLIVYKPTGLLW